MGDSLSVRKLFAGLALTALLSGCGQDSGSLPPAQDDGSVSGVDGASCAAVLDYQGHRYLGHGDLLRDPPTTGRLETGSVPGCDDGGGAESARTVRVAELAGIPTRHAVLVEDVLYIRTGRALPIRARKWFVAPVCQTRGRFRLRGDWISVQGPREVRFDGDIRPPYRLGVHVARGPEKYLGATIQIHATRSTRPTLGPRDVKSSLWKGGDIVAVVRCTHHDFLATALESTPG